MAQIAVPIIALGSLYILSQQDKNGKINKINTKKTNNLKSNSLKKNNICNNDSNIINNNIENIITEPYTNMNESNNITHIDNKCETKNNITLMNGDNITKDDFKHNNMQPYFGAKLRGTTRDLNVAETILDNKQGYGSQYISKVEQAPLFKPDDNTSSSYGMPNNNNFFQSRMNESMKMSNVTLWEPQRVGPGLNLGYGNQDENGKNIGGTEGLGGFNSGMMSRELWMPKNVDELRVDNNSRQTFDLNGHQGPAQSMVKMNGSNDRIGKIEKHLPEKYYESGPDKWFTTNGAEKNPPVRSTHIMSDQNRLTTTQEYYGAGANSGAKATYGDTNFQESTRQTLDALPISNASASGKNKASRNDYSVNSYKILPNNRTTDVNAVPFGGVYGMAKAVVSPLLDIFKPSRKENVIGNLRQSGNVNGVVPSGHLYNNKDKTKTTNREMTTDKIGLNYLNLQAEGHGNNNISVAQYQAIQNQRGTTNYEYMGGGNASGVGARTYNSAYAQQNNVNKTYESRANQGNMALFNNNIVMDSNRNHNLIENNRNVIRSHGPSLIPSYEFMGEVNNIQTYDNNINNERLDGSLLNAFKNNPYTQSLSSVA